MNTLEFLSQLRSAGIQISTDGEKLRCNAPKDVLTSSLRSELAVRKAEIISLLQSNSVNNSEHLKIKTVSRNQSIPLSFAQQRLWFLDKLESNNAFYNITSTVRLSGNIDIQALQQSLDAIVAHHEILRTNYISENETPIQVIRDPRPVDLQIINLQKYEKVEQENQIQKLLQQEGDRPFNLASDLMLRACLLQLAPEEPILLLAMHHIASDAWSMGILRKQLTELYKAFVDHKPNPLSPLLIQYADYAVCQKEWLSGEVLDKQLNYWKEQLAGINPLLELPTDRPRPAVQTYRGASQSFALPKNLSEKIQQLCRQEGVTLYMALLAAFQTLLYRYSKQEDILVGSPISGRHHAEVEGLIGFFVNTLVIRTDLSGNPCFAELLQQVRSVNLDAYNHQDLPFEKLVEELNPERSLSYNPLFQVMFVLQHADASNQTEGLLGLGNETSVKLKTETAKFDLTLFVWEQDAEIQGLWEYSTDLFDDTTIKRMSRHFQTLLESIIDDPQKPIDQLSLLSQAEQRQLLVEWNNTYTEYPRGKCLYQLFEEQTERTPEAIAVVFENEQLTYNELNKKANQLAHYLHKLGAGPDVAIGLCLERSLEMMIGLLGILKAGSAYLPLDRAYPQERLSFMIQDTQVPVLLTSKSLAAELPEHNAQVVYLDADWDNIAEESQDNLITDVQPTNLGYIIYTSGSTGKPKGVAMPQIALGNLILWQLQNTMISAQAKTLQFSPISFDVSFQEIFSTWSSGGTLVLITEELRRDARDLLNLLEQQAVERLFLPFVALQQLAEVAESSGVFPQSLKEVITAGEQLHITPAISCLFRNLKNATLHNHYGPSESHVVTTFTLNGSVETWPALPPIGRAIANTQMYILDTYLQPVPIGVPGELYIGGVSLAKGYLNRLDLTAEKFIPNPFSNGKDRLYKTGDLARYLIDGNIEYLGRIDNQVKIRGYRIELGEVEATLAKHPDIQETTIIAREDIPGNKRLVAYLVASAKESPTNSELRQFLQKSLPDYMIPSVFVTLESFPLTPSGKIDRRSLPQPNASAQISQIYVAPRSPLEEQIATIWQESLQLEKISIYDNFFELGGHSLLAVKVFSKMEKIWNKKFPLSLLFQKPTIAEIGQFINDKQEQAPFSSLVALQASGSKIPLFFTHAIGTSVQFYRSLVQCIGADQPFYGLQSLILEQFQSNSPLSIEDMAAFHIQEIQKVQPEGPYLVGGYCYGGNIAYEIAQQLQKAGHKVAMLAVIDGTAPGGYRRRTPQEQIIAHWNRFRAFGIEYAAQTVSRQLDFRMSRMKQSIKKRIQETKMFVDMDGSTIHGKEFFELRLRQVEELHWQALDAYQFKKYSGVVTLFRAEIQSNNAGDEYEKLMGWNKWAEQGAKLVDIPGDHNSILEEPNVEVLAEKLNSCIQESLRSV